MTPTGRGPLNIAAENLEEMRKYLLEYRCRRNASGPLTDLEGLTFRNRREKEALERIVKNVRILEVCLQTSKCTWEGLEEWIEGALVKCQVVGSVTSGFDGVKMPSTDEDGEAVLDSNLLAVEDNTRRLGPLYSGPRWRESHQNTFGRISRQLELPTTLPARADFEELARAVLQSWDALKNLNENGSVATFKKVWQHMSRESRMLALREISSIPDNACFYVKSLSKRPQGTWHKLAKTIEMPPSVNLKDLCDGDNLLTLLEARVAHHPRAFWGCDTSLIKVLLGIDSGRACECKGGVEFNQQDYSMTWSALSADPCSWQDPCVFAQMLAVHRKTYDFLMTCVEQVESRSSLTSGKIPSSYEHDETVAESGCQSGGEVEQASLSDLAAQMLRETYDHPGKFKVDLMRRLIKAAFEVCLVDLRDLQVDPERWQRQWLSLDQDQRLFRMLHEIIDPIDAIDSLKQYFEEVFAGHSLVELSPKTPNSEMKNFIRVDVAIRLTINALMSTLCNGSWPRADDDGLRQLHSLVKKGDFRVWRMGLLSVARVMEEGFERHQVPRPVPKFLLQKLKIISTLALMLEYETTCIYFADQSTSKERTRFALEAMEEFEARDRPWQNLIKDTMTKLGDGLISKFKSLDTTHKLKESHNAFWQTVVLHLSGGREQTDIVRAHAPARHLASPDLVHGEEVVVLHLSGGGEQSDIVRPRAPARACASVDAALEWVSFAHAAEENMTITAQKKTRGKRNKPARHAQGRGEGS